MLRYSGDVHRALGSSGARRTNVLLGSEFYDDCTSGDTFRLGVCGGFMSGVLETLEAYHVICIPAGVSGPDVGYWVTTYATNNRADLPGHNAVDLVFSALNAKWLC